MSVDVLGIMGIMFGDEMDTEIGADSDIDTDDDEYSSIDEMMDSSSCSESNDMKCNNDTPGSRRGCGGATGCSRASGHGRGGTGAAGTRIKKSNEVNYQWKLLGESKTIIYIYSNIYI